MKSIKSKIVVLSLSMLTLLFSSCEELADKMTVSLDVPESSINFDVEPQSSQAMKVASATSESIVLLDRTINVNLADVLADNGYSLDAVTSFLLTSSSLELVSPVGFNMDIFQNVKLYLDDQTHLVAEAQSVDNETGIITINIADGELLDMLQSDQIHIILVGDAYPSEKVSLKLKTKFKVKLQVLNKQ